MARPLRIQYAGAWCHLTGRGNDRRTLFLDDRDRLHFVELLGECVARYRLRIVCYVLMDNHWHALAQLRAANLSAAGQWLGDSYAGWFNRRHRRAGHVFGGRFKSILVEGEAYGCEVSRYVHLNPVRTKREGLDKRAQALARRILERPPSREVLAARLHRLREYRWSSYRAYIGLARPPEWLDLAAVYEWLGGGSPAEAGALYRRYAEEAVREGLAESPWEKLVAGVVLGGPVFLRKARRWLAGNAREQPELRGLRARASFAQVVGVVEEVHGGRWGEFRDRYGDWGRDLALYLGRRYGELTLRQLGEAAGGMDYGAVGLAVSRFGQRATRDKRLTRALTRAERRLAHALRAAGAQMLNV